MRDWAAEIPVQLMAAREALLSGGDPASPEAAQALEADVLAFYDAAWDSLWGLTTGPSGSGFAMALPVLVSATAAPWRTESDDFSLERMRVQWLLADADGLVHHAAAEWQGGVTSTLEAALAGGTVIVTESPVRPGMMTFGLQLHPGQMPMPAGWRNLAETALRAHAASIRKKSVGYGRLQKPMRAAAQRFRDGLNQEALEAVGRARTGRGLGSVGAYNVFAGAGAPPGRVAELGVWRRRALDVFPLFAQDIRIANGVREAIDASSPLADAIARTRGLKRTTVKAMAGWPFGEGIRTSNRWLTARLADSMPPDWLPRDAEGWLALKSLASALKQGGLLDPTEDNGPQLSPGAIQPWRRDAALRDALLASLMRRVGRDWRQTAEWVATDPARRGLGHLADTGGALVFQAALPALAAAGADQVALPHIGLIDAAKRLGTDWICSLLSVRQAVRLSSAHLDQAIPVRPQEGLAAVTDRRWIEWMPLAEDATSPEGLLISNLTNQLALDEEGRLQNHCVADYGSGCLVGVCRILSVRLPGADGTHRSLSTAEIRVLADGSLEVRQHRAAGNKAPTAAAREALAWYVEQVARKLIPSNVQALAAVSVTLGGNRGWGGWGQPRRGHPIGQTRLDAFLDGAAGFDWRDVAMRETARGRWAHWLALKGPAASAPFPGLTREVLLLEPGCPLRQALLPLWEAGWTESVRLAA